LWQKIFGAPAAAPKPETETSRADDSRERTAFERAEVHSTTEDVAGWTSAPPADSDATVDSIGVEFRDDEDGFEARGEGAGDESTGEEGAPGEGRRRRSRRRRGGRGRKGEDRPEGRQRGGSRRNQELLETPGADDFDDAFEDFGDDDAGAGSPLAGEADDDALGDDESDETDGGASTSRSRSAGHRGIPSWDEAIGIMVDANMQTRSQRRPTSNGSGQRGRPRGGRRRRKPS
jgi:hypothetical protein